jgi:hypothetical protein
MRTFLSIAAIAALMQAGCNNSPEGGTPGTNSSFSLSAPTLSTTIKQDNKESVKLTLHRGSDFKKTVSLTAVPPEKIKADFSKNSFAPSDSNDAMLNVTVAKDGFAMNSTKEHDRSINEIDTLNSLLLCQLAAVETYDRAIDKFEDHHVLADLQAIREEHLQAEILLREKVLESGGEPVAASEPWGACTAAITGAEKVMGPATALAALRQGEEHSINEFEDSLKHENLNLDCKNLIRSNLLPTSRKHVAELDRLMGGMS